MSQRRRKIHFVTIQSEPSAEDGLGQPSGVWTERLVNAPCYYSQLSGRELERARFKYDEADYTIEMFRPDFEITEAMRAVVITNQKTRTLEIGHVGELDDVAKELILTCKEVA